MSLDSLDWSTFIAEVTEIPEDLVLQIMEEGHLYEIKAHKMVLCMVSPTFKTMLDTTNVGDKTIREIEIKETTKQALQIIINALYKIKSIQDSLQGKTIQVIFDVVNLIERYQMAKLQNAINEVISNYPITEESVLEVAEEAIHQSELFQKEANLLLLACAKFIKPKLKDAKSIFQYFKDNGDQKEVIAALMVLMDDISTTECSNCGYVDCRDGQEVHEGEFREGLLVTNNRAASYIPNWNVHDFGTGKVTRMDAVLVRIENINGGLALERWTALEFTGLNYQKTNNGRNLFLFKCN